MLELLSARDAHRQRGRATAASEHTRVDLREDLRTTLERVGAGYDTPDKLTRTAADSAQILTALSELELLGLLTRGEGGRYVPRQADL